MEFTDHPRVKNLLSRCVDTEVVDKDRVMNKVDSVRKFTQEDQRGTR